MKPLNVKSFDGEHTINIKEYQKSLRDWPQAYRAQMDDYGTPFISGPVHNANNCGCKITGNGTLQFPLTILYCDKHKGLSLKQVEELERIIYTRLMSDPDMGMGEMGDCEDAAKEDVQQWLTKLDVLVQEPEIPKKREIKWHVFNARDNEAIHKLTGYTLGDEIEAPEGSVLVMFSPKKLLYIWVMSDGRFYTEGGRDSACGTLQQCIDLIEREIGETVE